MFEQQGAILPLFFEVCRNKKKLLNRLVKKYMPDRKKITL